MLSQPYHYSPNYIELLEEPSEALSPDVLGLLEPGKPHVSPLQAEETYLEKMELLISNLRLWGRSKMELAGLVETILGPPPTALATASVRGAIATALMGHKEHGTGEGGRGDPFEEDGEGDGTTNMEVSLKMD